MTSGSSVRPECDASRRPSLFKQFLYLGSIKGSELMDEAYTRVELSEAGNALFDTGHADQHHAGRALVKDRSHLLEAVHLETISLAYEDQGGRIPNRPLLCLK